MNCPNCGNKRFVVTYLVVVDAFVEDCRVDRVVSYSETISRPQTVQCLECSTQFEAAEHEAARIADEATWPAWEQE